MKYVVTLGADTIEVDVEPRADGTYLVRDAVGSPLEVSVTADGQHPGLLSLLVDGQTVAVQAADGELRYRQERYTARAQNLRDRAASILASRCGRVAHRRGRVMIQDAVALRNSAGLRCGAKNSMKRIRCPVRCTLRRSPICRTVGLKR